MAPRKWQYVGTLAEGCVSHITHTVTEDDILETYWPYWRDQMFAAGKSKEVSVEGCIQDFVAVHQATEVIPVAVAPDDQC